MEGHTSLSTALVFLYRPYAGKKIAGVLKKYKYIECTNNMATYNGCERIVG